MWKAGTFTENKREGGKKEWPKIKKMDNWAIEVVCYRERQGNEEMKKSEAWKW